MMNTMSQTEFETTMETIAAGMVHNGTLKKGLTKEIVERAILKYFPIFRYEHILTVYYGGAPVEYTISRVNWKLGRFIEKLIA